MSKGTRGCASSIQCRRLAAIQHNGDLLPGTAATVHVRTSSIGHRFRAIWKIDVNVLGKNKQASEWEEIDGQVGQLITATVLTLPKLFTSE
jgi:hypothetical protein